MSEKKEIFNYSADTNSNDIEMNSEENEEKSDSVDLIDAESLKLDLEKRVDNLIYQIRKSKDDLKKEEENGNDKSKKEELIKKNSKK